MDTVLAWFRFAGRVWISLGIGWLLLVSALLPYISMGQAGAFLVCSSIVAEVFLNRHHQLFIDKVLPGFRNSYTYEEIDSEEGGQKNIEVSLFISGAGKPAYNKATWALFHLALESEIGERDGRPEWDLELTMQRLEKVIEKAIVFTAIIGTLLWAFA